MIYSVEFPAGQELYTTNYRSNAMRKMRRLCALNEGKPVYIVDKLVPPYYLFRYVDGILHAKGVHNAQN